MICLPLREIEALLIRLEPSVFPFTTTIWQGAVPQCEKGSVKVWGGPAARVYSLGPNTVVIGAATGEDETAGITETTSNVIALANNVIAIARFTNVLGFM